MPLVIRGKLVFLMALFLVPWCALANVEKTVFVAPPLIAVPSVRPGFQDLRLTSLSPSKNILRTHLPVAFPSEDLPRGLESWYLLGQLTPGHRYEVRVCWAATQPASFRLDTYSISRVFDTPPLITAIAAFSESLSELRPVIDDRGSDDTQKTPASLLFLRIQAAADFFTLNKTRMSSPPDVKVDIILDPYVLNAVPRSLVPTAFYVIVVAVGAWCVSSFVVNCASAIERAKLHTD